MTNYVVVDTMSFQTDPPDDDGGEWSWQGGSGLAITGVYLTKNEFKKNYDSIETELEYGFVVVANYTDGGTFGYSGCIQMLEVFSSVEEAKEFIKVAKANEDYDFTYKDKWYSREWVGYFAGLDSLDFHAFG